MPIELPPGTAAYSDRHPPPQNRQLLTLLGLFIGALVLVVWLAQLLVGGLVGLIPPGAEQQLGRLTVPAFERLAQPSATQASLNQLLDRLEQQLPPEQRQNRDYRVLYIPEDTVNALAIPGDRIIIYQGLLGQMESENELMMVLGHELGHFAHRDHLRSLGRGLVLRLALATILGDGGWFQSIAASGVTALSNARFSQQQEYQADIMGLDLLYAVYGQVAGATDFFQRLSQQQGVEIEFLATHPTSQKRVRQLDQLIDQRSYPQTERSPLPPALAQRSPSP